MRLDLKKQSRERAENKVIYNLLSVTKGNQITTHYSRHPRKKKSHGLEKRGHDAFLSQENFFVDPHPAIVSKWSAKPRLQCGNEWSAKSEVNYWVDFELKWVFHDPGISYRCPTQSDLTYTVLIKGLKLA